MVRKIPCRLRRSKFKATLVDGEIYVSKELSINNHNNQYKQNPQDGKYAALKDTVILLFLLFALLFTFCNLPGMVAVAIYCTKMKPLDINQCWTFSLCFTAGLFVLLRIVCRKAGSAFKGHLLISFLAFAYLGNL
jgi:hypothetical protein